MEKITHTKKEMLLPSFLLNDIEFDELDKGLQLVPNCKKEDSTKIEE